MEKELSPPMVTKLSPEAAPAPKVRQKRVLWALDSLVKADPRVWATLAHMIFNTVKYFGKG